MPRGICLSQNDISVSIRRRTASKQRRRSHRFDRGLECGVVAWIADPDRALADRLARPLIAEIATAPPGGDLAWQRAPQRRLLRERVEQLDVVGALVGVAEVAGVGVGDRLDQPETLLDCLYLFEPCLGRSVAEEREQNMVLRQRPRKLDDPPDRVWPQAAAAARLRFVAVGVGDAAIVVGR